MHNAYILVHTWRVVQQMVHNTFWVELAFHLLGAIRAIFYHHSYLLVTRLIRIKAILLLLNEKCRIIIVIELFSGINEVNFALFGNNSFVILIELYSKKKLVVPSSDKIHSWRVYRYTCTYTSGHESISLCSSLMDGRAILMTIGLKMKMNHYLFFCDNCLRDQLPEMVRKIQR